MASSPTPCRPPRPSGYHHGMTAAISYEEESAIVTTDSDSRLQLASPETQYVKVVEADGTIRLIPLGSLHESERAILEDRDLHDQTRKGLDDFVAGRGASSDWLFEDE